MANIFSWATRDKKEVDKLVAAERDNFITFETNYDDVDGYDVPTGRRLWAKRSMEELEKEWFAYMEVHARSRWEDVVRKRTMTLFKRSWEYQAMLKTARDEVANDLGLDNGQGCFFITIRPDQNKTTFPAFYETVTKFLKRRCFTDFTAAFEQKGTTDDSLGTGFHVHIVAHMKQRSKGEVLRDTMSTFEKTTAPNCIQVDLAPRPQEIIQKYLIGYVSKDGHKQCTQEWDAKWRDTLQLQHVYTNNDVMPSTVNLPIKSNRQVTISMV